MSAYFFLRYSAYSKKKNQLTFIFFFISLHLSYCNLMKNHFDSDDHDSEDNGISPINQNSFTRSKKDIKKKPNYLNSNIEQKKNNIKNKPSLQLFINKNPMSNRSNKSTQQPSDIPAMPNLITSSKAKNDREIKQSLDMDTNSDQTTVRIDKQITEKIHNLIGEIDETLNIFKAQYCNHAYSIHKSTKAFMNFYVDVKQDYSTYMSEYDVVKSILEEWETMDDSIKRQYGGEDTNIKLLECGSSQRKTLQNNPSIPQYY